MSATTLAALVAIALAGAPAEQSPKKKPAASATPMKELQATLKRARPDLERCAKAADPEACTCALLRGLRFPAPVDSETLSVTMPLSGKTFLTFTLDAAGRVVDCSR
ncbi:MAG: hypothetical protein Q8L14_09985 [Myxococcales bacterium]|nr:hypothetical protein [Myxococcales bacterium]